MGLVRDNAKNQLDFFEIMKMFGVMMIAEVVREHLEPLRIDPLPLDDPSLGLEALAQVGPGGCFLDHDHTLEHFRGLQGSDVFQSTDYDRWAREGRRQAAHLAHEKALKLIAAYQRPPLDAELEAEIDGYVEAHR
jgi:trimethylamine--corrinoid protein Co-methyltransferase